MSTKRTIYDSNNIHELFEALTVVGKLVFPTAEAQMKTVRLAREFSKTVRHALRYDLYNRDAMEEARKRLKEEVPLQNKHYMYSALKQAKMIKEGIEFWEAETGERIIPNIRKFWIYSYGTKTFYGNPNIRLKVLDHYTEVQLLYPGEFVGKKKGECVKVKAFFGKEQLPIIREITELGWKKEDGYGVVVFFRDVPYIAVQVPIHIYLKHTSTPLQFVGSYVMGIDLNSDRINAVVVNPDNGKIVAMKTFWFPEVTSHGFPRELAKQRRLQALAEALKWGAERGADTVAFEDLFRIKRKGGKVTKSRRGNRKATKFAKKQLLQHGILKAVKYGYRVVLIDPAGTTNSEEHDRIAKERGLDRHMASAYLVALRGMGAVD